jgi:hypothetical protein
MILPVKSEKQRHKVFGQFASENKRLSAIATGANLNAAAYNDGHLMFWPHRINVTQLLMMPGHRGPVCGLHVPTNSILSCDL